MLPICLTTVYYIPFNLGEISWSNWLIAIIAIASLFLGLNQWKKQFEHQQKIKFLDELHLNIINYSTNLAFYLSQPNLAFKRELDKVQHLNNMEIIMHLPSSNLHKMTEEEIAQIILPIKSQILALQLKSKVFNFQNYNEIANNIKIILDSFNFQQAFYTNIFLLPKLVQDGLNQENLLKGKGDEILKANNIREKPTNWREISQRNLSQITAHINKIIDELKSSDVEKEFEASRVAFNKINDLICENYKILYK